MEKCQVCGKDAEYKVTTSLNPNAVDYFCKRHLKEKEKELETEFNSMFDNPSGVFGSILSSTFKNTMKQMLKVEKIKG